MKEFKIRSSAIGSIMGKCGLSDKQIERKKELSERVKPMTPNMILEFDKLIETEKETISTGCKTYLKKWYAQQLYCDSQEIRSKYFDKGNIQEVEAIEEVAIYFDLGLAFKNIVFFENEYITGTPDLLTTTTVYDTKCSWDGSTFLDSAMGEVDEDYVWQLLGYMNLTKRVEAKLCYVLLNTPEEANYGTEIIYDNIPMNQRFKSFNVDYCEEKIKAIHEKVVQCRVWLQEYDLKVKECLNLNN